MEINLTEGGVLSIIKESPHNGLTLQLLNLSPLRSSFNSAIQHRVDLSDGNHIQPALLPSKFAGHVLDKILQEGSIVLLRKYVCRNYNKDLTVLITDMDNIVSTWPRQGTPVPVPEHILRGKETKTPTFNFVTFKCLLLKQGNVNERIMRKTGCTSLSSNVVDTTLAGWRAHLKPRFIRNNHRFKQPRQVQPCLNNLAYKRFNFMNMHCTYSVTLTTASEHTPGSGTFLLNLIMRHRSQATASVFMRQDILQNIPTSISDLRQRLQANPNDALPQNLMRFGASLRGTRSFWLKSRGELSDMVEQLATPTLFFTLSAADTKWPDLHSVMPDTSPADPREAQQWRNHNIISNPHRVSAYLHQRFTVFREEVLQNYLGATDYWYRYEWQHRGSAHVHGFLWLPEAVPNVETIDWSDTSAINQVREYFDKLLSAWNPRSISCRSEYIHRPLQDDPCLLKTSEILATDPLLDLEEILNRVQRHTKCSERTCLRKKKWHGMQVQSTLGTTSTINTNSQ
ncbi:hypothetical protein KI387_042066 [Taxus chinensis]|uniref:Helitron helicase-like domain-containing protein n=1 Tax=Taxus chinensis TaxID=29808 RepID=A0AA38C911_TAXCH|nr:hypothetical protein KI387_042066 [Taxus chinensis]